jgi:hypothetical protein
LAEVVGAKRTRWRVRCRVVVAVDVVGLRSLGDDDDDDDGDGVVEVRRRVRRALKGYIRRERRERALLVLELVDVEEERVERLVVLGEVMVLAGGV